MITPWIVTVSCNNLQRILPQIYGYNPSRKGFACTCQQKYLNRIPVQCISISAVLPILCVYLCYLFVTHIPKCSSSKSRILLSFHMDVRVDRLQPGGSLLGPLILLCQWTAEGWVLQKAASCRIRLLGWHWLQRLVLVEHLPIYIVSPCGELGFLTVWQTQMKLKEVPECHLCHASWKGQGRFPGRRGTKWKTGPGRQGRKRMAAAALVSDYCSGPQLPLFPGVGVPSYVVSLLA